MKNLNDLREQALAVINRDVGRMVANSTPVYRTGVKNEGIWDIGIKIC